MVLSTMSKYFKARLESGLEPQATASASPAAPLELRIPLESEELEAAEVLLRCMYGATAESAAKLVFERRSQSAGAGNNEGARMILILRAYRLADRFEALQCMEVFSQQIRAFEPSNITLEVAVVYFGLQPALRDRLETMGKANSSQLALSFLSACSQVLLSTFGDVPLVIRSPELTAQFQSLPYAAVLDWSRQDTLAVHSENCVVYLLSAWIDVHSGLSTLEANELADNIRVLHLSDAYLHTLLPNLDWIKSCTGVKTLPALHYIRLGTLSKSSWPGPKPWVAERRNPIRSVFFRAAQGSNPGTPFPVILEKTLSPDDIAAMESDKSFKVNGSSGSVYVNGFWINIAVMSRNDCQGAVHVVLNLVMSPTTSGCNPLIGAWKNFGQGCVQLRSEIYWRYFGTGNQNIPVPCILHEDTGKFRFITAEVSSVYPVITKVHPNQSLRDAIAPYLVDGCLKLRVTLNCIK